MAAVEHGAANLRRHLQIVKEFGLPCVVAVNRRPGYTNEEVELVRRLPLEGGAFAAEVNDGFARSGAPSCTARSRSVRIESGNPSEMSPETHVPP